MITVAIATLGTEINLTIEDHFIGFNKMITKGKVKQL